MKCSLCGFEFREEDGKSSCSSCPVHRGCGLVRCPNCGFETPPDPKWFKAKEEKDRNENQ